MIAIRKRIATNEIGGRSRRPTLMASQVELQTTQSVSHARGTPHPVLGCQLCFSIAIFISSTRENRVWNATRKARSRGQVIHGARDSKVSAEKLAGTCPTPIVIHAPARALQHSLCRGSCQLSYKRRTNTRKL